MVSSFIHSPCETSTDFIIQWSQQADNATIDEAVADNTTEMAHLGPTASKQLEENDEKIAPIKWKSARTPEQETRFFGYYESRGFKTVSTDKYPFKRFQPQLTCNDDEPFVQFIRDPVRTGEFASDTWEHSPIVKTGRPSDLAVIETERREKLENAETELVVMEAEEATGEAEKVTKEARLRKQRHLIATLSVPFQVFVPPVRPDNEQDVEKFDSRKTSAPISDKNCPDPAKETQHRFGSTIQLMKKNGAMPEDWQEGDI